MYQESQPLHVMFECANMQVANHLVFSLSGKMLPQTNLGATQGTHSEGRYVFTTAEGTPKELYDKAMLLCDVYSNDIALISVTPANIPWDPYSLRLLESTEQDSILWMNARKMLEAAFEEHALPVIYSECELANIFAICSLPELDGLLGLLDEIPRYGMETIQLQCINSVGVAQPVAKRFVTFRVMAHLTLKQQYIR